uniref:Pre-rRNA-processing protein Ipi1 N-terminal domain-containing protein n=1 Tax=Peronospora matthiolae TaxID=2874970 RepID=A0AAV1VEH4_9STRA
MVRAATTSKPKKKPADFKRPKRKVGRRAAPAANVTSVGITSRRINLLEQSLLQDKTNAAQLTHRRQALPELLQQIGHYNAHMRQRALQGLKELATQDTARNLRANASVLLERFLPALLDEEGVVRDAAVQVWKAMLPVLSSALKPFATLVVTYFCSGLTHLQVGVRQDALKAINELVTIAPELLQLDAGREARSRLLDNFRDLIGAAQTQGIRMKNTYDVLVVASEPSGSRGNKKRADGRQKVKSCKKADGPSGALALRFVALKVLHKVLLAVGAEQRSNRMKKTTQTAQSTAEVPMTKTLLLYPTPQLVAPGMLAAATAASLMTNAAGKTGCASWQEKARTLLPALLELWLECVDESSDALSDVHVEHMTYIVECTTAVVSANTSLLNVDADVSENAEFFQITLKLREQLLAPESFPMLPSASAALSVTSDGSGALSRWHGLNVSLAKLACEFLRLPTLMRGSDRSAPPGETLKHRVCTYVTTTLVKYKETAELRAVASMQNVLRPLLEVVELVLLSFSQLEDPLDVEMTTDGEQTRILDAVTQFYVLCTPTSVSFRTCTAFVIKQLDIALRGQQRRRQKLEWPMVMQWVVCLAELLSQLDLQHMELGRRSLRALISVLKQLPANFASGDQMDGVLTNLSNFFNLAAVPSSSMPEDGHQRMLARTRFDALGAADQLAFAAILYHLPRYPVHLLRALASSCKSPRIYNEAKSFLVDILFQRRESVDLAHIVSFFVSTALAPVEASPQIQQQQLQLVDHVCRAFVAMNLGNSLPKILAPTLAKAQSREGMTSIELHTSVLLYRACLSSATTHGAESLQRRTEIPAEMERELVSLSVKVLEKYYASLTTEQSTVSDENDSRRQERLLVLTCISTLALGEITIFARFLDELLVVEQSRLVLTCHLRVLQALVRSPNLSGAFRRHQDRVEQLLQVVEQQCADERDISPLVRQLRGDFELLSVGQLVDSCST